MRAATTTRGVRRPEAPARLSRRAFTVIDVLVSIAVIAVLISLLLPSLAKVNETARRVVCQSNVRQIGLGLVMYADDYKGFLPPSIYMPLGASGMMPRGEGVRPQDMVAIRLPVLENPNGWDGLGMLYQHGYMSAPKVYYCPSHMGENHFSKYAPTWNETHGEIYANYHFRGIGPARPGTPALLTANLYKIDPAHSSLLADGLQTRSDFNHKVGANFFRADLTVHWFEDAARRIPSELPEGKGNAGAGPVVRAWDLFDDCANANN